MSVDRVVIVGAGLAGALMACFLGRRGVAVEVFERRPDPRAKGFIGGRSINLALSARGIAALEKVGLAERVLADAVPMRGRMMHATNGILNFQPYSKNPEEAIKSVSRGGLNLTLLEAADAFENVTLHFGRTDLGVDLDTPSVTLTDEETGQTKTTGADLVIGGDGAFSAVRAVMQRTNRFDYSQSYLEHGYKELTIPPTPTGDFAMEPNALHIWPRGGFMMIALPNADRSFTCTCFWPYTGPHGFDRLQDDTSIVRYFERQFGDAVPLMPELVDEYVRNPIGSLVTVRCRPWHYKDSVVLLGDAAHAVVPFYGQGMNAAFEDCVVLDDCLGRAGIDRSAALLEYTVRRKENADALADLALHNFIEMRDKVASPAFLLSKRGEKLLHRTLPFWYTPLYNMVTFSTIPYARARERARRQSRTIRMVMASVVIVVALGVLLLIRGLI